MVNTFPRQGLYAHIISLILMATLESGCYYFPDKDEEIEASKGQMSLVQGP